jgi:predicted secreted protein|tara:strand:+ start:113 stop:544 length:432 start_codon:yes stop_codon:yes gene_type:complete
MAILNGTSIKVYDSGTGILVAFAQNGTLNINHSLREITNKESNGFKESLEGLRDFSIELDGAYAWTDAAGSALTNGADDLLNSYILTRDSLTVKFGNVAGATGDTVYQGRVFLTAFSVSAGTEDTATYSLSLEGTGAITQTVS